MQEQDEDVHFSNHLLRVCKALGSTEEGVYRFGDEVLGKLHFEY
jgi:hypothetical protein